MSLTPPAQGFTGSTAEGWEEVTAEDTRKDAARSVREYRDNQPEHAVRFRAGCERLGFGNKIA